MPERVQILRIVVASPGDVQAERDRVPIVVDELNRGIAADRGLHLEVYRWETDAYPGFNAQGPQGLIDTILRIEDSDVVIGIFWKRFGTPTKEGTTGTEHEIRRAYQAWEKQKRPQLMVYFNQKPSTPQSEEETSQWGQVLKFRKEFPKEGLWWPYRGTAEFERLLRAHLTNFIRDKFRIEVAGGDVLRAQGVVSSVAAPAPGTVLASPPPASATEEALGKAIGPRLHLEYDTVKWPRCREYVIAKAEGPSVWSPPVTGAMMTPESMSNALYVRLHLSISGHSPASQCGVFVERIERGGRVLEHESSALNWTDIDSFDPRHIWEGHGAYVDVCAVHREFEGLRVLSQKGVKGYIFAEHGAYVLDITARASGSSHSVRLELEYGESSWDSLNVLSWTEVENRSSPSSTESVVRSGQGEALGTVAAPAPGTVSVNPRDGLNYVWIPPGRFQMGCSPGDTECFDDEKPAHAVTVSKGFWLGQTPVTVAAYKRFVGNTGQEMPPAPSFNEGWNREQMPIVNVTWDDAQAYCKWAGGRLPTEAEWEYAARAGSAEPRYGPLPDNAWYQVNSSKRTHEVGQKRKNGFGLYDMLGNVSEWVNDWYDEKYYQNSPDVDPSGPLGGEGRVMRGASWLCGPSDLRTTWRYHVAPDQRISDVGFRCVREVIP